MRAAPFFRLRPGLGLGAVGLLGALALLFGLRALRPSWEASVPAMRLGSLPAELFFIDAPKLARRGPSRLIVLRFDGDVEVVPHHYKAHGLAAPEPIDRWREVVNAPLLINAGQFDGAMEHLGWLRARGTWLRAQRHASWLGLLVSDRRPTARLGDASARRTRIIDLASESPELARRYDNIVQSMMLIDESGALRVRNTSQAACRTVIGEDRAGRLLVVLTEGAVTLGELASFLSRPPLSIVRALNLDGGIESQLALTSDEVQLTLFGQYGVERTALGPHQPLGRAALPAVLAVSPVERVSESAAAPR